MSRISIPSVDNSVEASKPMLAAVQKQLGVVPNLMKLVGHSPAALEGYRTQFMYRLVEFSQESGITINLAYYPPYHSKYNPVERCWGILENHWNGSILDNIEAVVGCASSMTWKGRHPVVKLVEKCL